MAPLRMNQHTHRSAPTTASKVLGHYGTHPKPPTTGRPNSDSCLPISAADMNTPNRNVAIGGVLARRITPFGCILCIGGALLAAAGCSSSRLTKVPPPPAAETAPPQPPAPERVALNRTATEIAVSDRTTLTADDAWARARLALEKGSGSDLRTAGRIMAAFGPESRKWHGEDQARFATEQILIGLAAHDRRCLENGIDNLTPAKPNLRGVIYENELTLLQAAHARLGHPKPDLAPTRLSTAMALYAPNRGARRQVEDLQLVEQVAGEPAKLKEMEQQVQQALFGFLGAWVRGDSAETELRHLLDATSLAEYRGFKVTLPPAAKDVDAFAVRSINLIFRELGTEI